MASDDKKPPFEPIDDDPFAKLKPKKWGFFKMRQMRKNKEMQEKIRAEEAFK